MSIKRFDGGLERGEAFIGIDQSLTGFAITALDSDNKYYTEVYKSPYFGVERLLDLQEFLADFLHRLPPLDIAMEGSVLQSHAALKLGELAGAVKLELLKKGHYPLQVPPMTLKKFASGKGNAKKQEMLLQMYKRWGVEFSDDNAADSYALARLIRGKGINAMEKQIIEQLKDPKYRDEPRLA
jgi:crossover junction endodeoxyribonuclease RuvC